jgi:hypothetical protein
VEAGGGEAEVADIAEMGREEEAIEGGEVCDLGEGSDLLEVLFLFDIAGGDDAEVALAAGGVVVGAVAGLLDADDGDSGGKGCGGVGFKAFFDAEVADVFEVDAGAGGDVTGASASE